jgi:hypothetical protein
MGRCAAMIAAAATAFAHMGGESTLPDADHR